MNQLKHISSDDVRRIKFSHNGSRFLVISRYDVISYLLDGTVDGIPVEPGGFFDAAYVGPDTIVASTALRGKLDEWVEALALYDLHNGHIIESIATNDVLSLCVDFSRNRILAGSLTGDLGGYVETYDFNLKRLTRFESKEMPFDMVISHSGNHIAVASVFFELGHQR